MARETVRIRGIEGRGHGAACDRDLSGRVTSLSQGGPRAGAVWAAGTRPGPADRPGYGASCLTVAHRDWPQAAARGPADRDRGIRGRGLDPGAT